MNDDYFKFCATFNAREIDSQGKLVWGGLMQVVDLMSEMVLSL